MEKKNAVYTITEDQSPEEARREHVMLVVRNLAAGAAAVLFLASFALADIHKLLRAAEKYSGGRGAAHNILWRMLRLPRNMGRKGMKCLEKQPFS